VEIYLPIADLPVNVFLLLGMGLAVGFVSGMFGIGGGFLMTPLLIFVGISPAVAVATISGVLLFTALRRLGQLDIVIGLSYLLLLVSVGAMMVAEGLRAILRARQGKPVELRRPGSHTWIHGLPLKIRFKQSKIYVSAIPVCAIGFIMGFIGAIMGFLLVPMLIYFLRVPTNVVIGTSMVLTLITMASATILHAATNHLVDAVLALVLMVGGVTGAQFGARAGQKMRSERLRLLLGILVLAVGLRFAFDLIVAPDDLYTIRAVGE
jgi:uncharacterized membrane protein YfcA